MPFKLTRLLHLKRGEDLQAKAKTGISLHCHTHFSKENLDFLPYYSDRIPIIAGLWRREYAAYREREQRDIDFDTAYWTPPLSANVVHEGEKRQIIEVGLQPIVSITDHDRIDANLEINRIESVPISMEWTVPFANGFFHVGVHNLPPECSESIVATLLEYTEEPDSRSVTRLNELFRMLWEYPNVLVVLNHPLWDIELIGHKEHEHLLKDFLKIHSKWIHAFEVNGFRKWSENHAVIELAESFGKPAVAGGDRHGCQPNTVLNISGCLSMDEYAADVRDARRNEIALMPCYERPICSRQLESFSEILREYPESPADRRNWMQRVFFDTHEGLGFRPISEIGMINGPFWMRASIYTLGILGSPRLAILFRFARRKADQVPLEFDDSHFALAKLEDLARHLSSEPVI